MTLQNTSDVQRLLQSDETFATVINEIVHRTYGDEAYDWDPLTVSLELKDDYGVDVSEGVLDKWCAIQTVMCSDAFFKRIDAFLSVCNTISSGQPFFSTFDPVTTEEAAWAITEISLNRDMPSFSNTIRTYITTILNADGYSKDNFPDVFNEALSKNPDEKKISEGAALANSDNTSNYVYEQLKDLTYQLGILNGINN